MSDSSTASTVTKDTKDAYKMDDVESRARANRNRGLRVSAVYREIDGKPGFGKDETAMLSRLREEIEKNDRNQDGEIDAAEMVNILRGVIKNHDQKQVLHKIIYGVVALVVLLVLATLGTGLAVASLTRKISSDDGGFAGPALVSASTGEMLYTRPEGSGGSTLLLAAFVSCDVKHDENCEPYRFLARMPAELSPNGENLQCAGVMLREDVMRAVRNAENTAAPIRMAYQIENRHEFVNIKLPSDTIEQVPDMRDPDSLGRRHLMESAENIVGDMTIPIIQTMEVEEMNDREFATKVMKLDGSMDTKKVGNLLFKESGQSPDLNLAGGGSETIDYTGDFRRGLTSKETGHRRRRLTAEKFAHPLSAPWYDFLIDSVSQSVSLVCSPNATGNPALCFLCSKELVDTNTTATATNP